MVRKFTEKDQFGNELFGLELNGQILVKAKFRHLIESYPFFIAPGRNGFIVFEVQKDENGNEVAVVNITKNAEEYC